ncbi:hypothetical protein JIQ42_01169 [Leishmania sp. Namibia]|uniref:hypothetical protein n=1 Tax=Leishmania sp. Namibia TaxID=2802991 RepID=UPI001B73FEC9|nr:hypothetical protein JIQ42_01169 [Leishmania sp. Namibia]
MARACRCAAMAKHVAAAALLALLSVSVAVSAVSLLPLSGWGTIDVELVCRTAPNGMPTKFSTTVISSLTFHLKWDGRTAHWSPPYPLTVERMLDDDFVRTYYTNATDKYTVSDSGGCVHTTGFFYDADEVLVAQTVADIMGLPLRDSYNSTVNRGIGSLEYSRNMSFEVPSAFGGLGTGTTYSTTVLTSVPGWTVNLVPVNQTVLSAEATATIDARVNNCLFTIFFLGTNVSDLLMPLHVPSSCNGTSSSSIRSLVAKRVSAARSSLQTVAGVAGALTSSPTASSESSSSIEAFSLVPASAAASSSSGSSSSSSAWFDDNNPTMPEFPGEFTADFFVISPSDMRVFEVREAFSAVAGISHATLLLPVSGVAGRSSLYEWFVDAYNQMAYFHTKYGVQHGDEANDKALREYFFPDKDTCQRVLIGYDLMAGSIRSLMMYSPSVPPTFIGNQTVRNVPCVAWAAEVNGFRVTWYWSATEHVNTTPFHTPESVRSGASAYSKLMRMTVEGQGGPPPMFPHHPFFQQPYAFPLADRSMACGVLGPGEGNVGCNENEDDDFLYIYDVTSFVPYVRLEDYTIPKACNGTMISGSIPSVLCRYGGVTGGVAAALLVVIALLFALVSGCCVWCPFSRMVRHQQDELARLTWEIHLAEGGNGTDGQDTAIVSATGCGADVKNSSS